MQRLVPETVEPAEPAVDVGEAAPLEGVVALASDAPFANDTNVEHEPEVLRHRRAADRQPPREIGRALLGAGQPFEQCSPNRMRDHAEGVVDDGRAGGSHRATIR